MSGLATTPKPEGHAAFSPDCCLAVFRDGHCTCALVYGMIAISSREPGETFSYRGVVKGLALTAPHSRGGTGECSSQRSVLRELTGTQLAAQAMQLT
jgi:hypothetical protein